MYGEIRCRAREVTQILKNDPFNYNETFCGSNELGIWDEGLEAKNKERSPCSSIFYFLMT